ncbi:MAG: hypothetical protein WBH03_16835 [Cyclobacteriaceae bacterium]
MKERLKLSELTIKTFVTTKEKVNLKGGNTTPEQQNCISYTCPHPDYCGGK